MGYVIVLNSFQTPNNYVDTAMAMLTAEEYKCLSFAARHILGWQDKISKRRGFISLGMFENGFISSKGVVFGGTGLARQTIIRATDELTRLLFLIPIGEPTEDGQEWELGESPDFDALAERYEAQKAQRKRQTAKARETKRESGLSNRPAEGGLSDRLEVVCPTYQRWFVQQTISGLFNRLNQIHSQNHLQKESQIEDFSSFPEKSEADQQNTRIWDLAMNQIELQFDRSTFESWIKGATYIREESGQWVIRPARANAAVVLQHRLYRDIRRVLRDVRGEVVELCFESQVQP